MIRLGFRSPATTTVCRCGPIMAQTSPRRSQRPRLLHSLKYPKTIVIAGDSRRSSSCVGCSGGVYGTEGREFESLRACRKNTPLRRGFFISGSARERALRVLVQTEVRTSAGAIVAARLVTLMVSKAVQR